MSATSMSAIRIAATVSLAALALSGVIIGAGNYTVDKAEALLARGYIDAAAFGRPYISNPDLVDRLRAGAPLAALNPATLYGGGAEGYTDYPALT